MRGQPGHNTRYLYHVMAPPAEHCADTASMGTHTYTLPCYGTSAKHHSNNASMGTRTVITCSAVILYADWLIGVRPGAVHTL